MAKKSKDKFFTPLRIVVLGAVLVILAGVLYSGLNPGQETPPAQASQPAESGTDEEPARVALAEAKKAFDEGKAVFVDTRSYDSYTESHVQGAVSIPLSETESSLDKLDPSSWIIPYCT